jgi:hypothetical protein
MPRRGAASDVAADGASGLDKPPSFSLVTASEPISSPLIIAAPVSAAALAEFTELSGG